MYKVENVYNARLVGNNIACSLSNSAISSDLPAPHIRSSAPQIRSTILALYKLVCMYVGNESCLKPF